MIISNCLVSHDRLLKPPPATNTEKLRPFCSSRKAEPIGMSVIGGSNTIRSSK